ncbi:MAG: nucleoside monophosphate kinase [Proteobacteria bacterium]|nr:nucleoside monophosphate kinase [Pseudomonadota bacterium]MBU4470525.1 nucleoside monophosphate kinase [Pseudomonadota bacterium]MCG2751361.1 nucleoside monophosphate kinase [Desulfobacteraceae bacterium]
MKPNAILLIGPTGSGKTPLGDLCQKQGIQKKYCFHFDFGENLRRAAEFGFLEEVLSSEDVSLIQKALTHGLLLENETFYIAEKILNAFIAENRTGVGDLILLNGMPRHIDQAEDANRLVNIISVVVLECASETVFERIQLNSGGDRSRRKDDSLAEIQNKLRSFHRRTLPLVEYFASLKVPVKTIRVEVHTTANDLLKEL